MNRNRNTKRFLTWSIVAVVAGSAVAWAAIRWLPSRAVLARRIGRQLETTPDERVATKLRQLADLGDDGIGPLVDALASTREPVAGGAQDVLNEKIERWRRLSLRDSTAKISLLAHHLARRTEDFSPLGKAFAANAATQILLWPASPGQAESQTLIADCERVLRASAGADQTTVSPIADNQNADANQRRVARASFLDFPGNLASDGLPGGGLPIEVVPAPPLPPVDDDPRQLAASPDAAPIPSAPPDNKPVGGKPVPVGLPVARDGNVPELPTTVESSAPDLPADTAQMIDLDTLEVIYQLRSEDRDQRSAAESQLRGRGFRAVHFVLAERLTDPDSQKRSELAAMLPRISNINARRWLLWLTRDYDPAVRREAISILATSRDAQLLNYLRQLEQHETDPEILRLIRRQRQSFNR